MSEWKLLLQRSDKYLLGTTVLLVAVGLLMIHSTTLNTPFRSSLMLRQLVSAALGFGLLLTAGAIEYSFWRGISLPFYILGIILLAGVLVFGKIAGGSVRWFAVGAYQFQPVEFMKLALIVYGAAFFERHDGRMRQLRYFLLSLLLVIIPIVLTLQQPDLGSSIVLGGIWLGQVLLSGTRRVYIIGLAVVSLLLVGVAWKVVLHDYQKARIENFFDPGKDPRGRGYNAIQAITAVGSGGLAGQGYGRGLVSQLRYLPERQTDFIFASLAEELGFIGSVFLISLFVIWQLRMVGVARRAGDTFSVLLACGIFFYLSLQSWINIGMNVGVVPITGVPLPLASFGGSSLLVSLLSVGILQSIAIHSRSRQTAQYAG